MNRRIVLPVLALSAVALLASASSAEARLFGRWAKGSCCEPVVCAPVVYDVGCYAPCRPGLLDRLRARLAARRCCPPTCIDPCCAPAPCTPVEVCKPVEVCEPVAVCEPVCCEPICCRPRLIDRLRARLHARHCCPPVSCCDVPVCGC